MLAFSLLLAATAPTTVKIEPFCANGVRIRISDGVTPIAASTDAGALSERCGASAPARSTGGPLAASVARGVLTVTRGGATLLSGAVPAFSAAACGADYKGVSLALSSPAGDRIYGGGQLENSAAGASHHGQPGVLSHTTCCDAPGLGTAPTCAKPPGAEDAVGAPAPAPAVAPAPAPAPAPAAALTAPADLPTQSAPRRSTAEPKRWERSR